MLIMTGSRLSTLFHLLCTYSTYTYRLRCVLTLCSHRYYDPGFNKWGDLRVINEDRVEPYEG